MSLQKTKIWSTCPYLEATYFLNILMIVKIENGVHALSDLDANTYDECQLWVDNVEDDVSNKVLKP